MLSSEALVRLAPALGFVVEGNSALRPGWAITWEELEGGWTISLNGIVNYQNIPTHSYERLLASMLYDYAITEPAEPPPE